MNHRKGFPAQGSMLLAALLAGSLVLAACGGGSGDSAASSATAAAVPKACVGVAPVAGSADALQNAIDTALIPYLASLPRTDSVVDLAAAVSRLLDVVDTLSVAQSGSPSAALPGTTAALGCSLGYLTQSLTQLAGDGLSLTPAASSIANDLLSTATATTALLNPASGTPDFAKVTGNLTRIATDLGSLLNALVAGGSASTPVVTLGNNLQAALTDVTRALNAALANDSSQLKAALAMAVQDLSGLASSNTLSALGVRNDALTGLVNSLSTGLNTALNTLLHLLGLT